MSIAFRVQTAAATQPVYGYPTVPGPGNAVVSPLIVPAYSSPRDGRSPNPEATEIATSNFNRVAQGGMSDSLLQNQTARSVQQQQMMSGGLTNSNAPPPRYSESMTSVSTVTSGTGLAANNAVFSAPRLHPISPLSMVGSHNTVNSSFSDVFSPVREERPPAAGTDAGSMFSVDMGHRQLGAQDTTFTSV